MATHFFSGYVVLDNFGRTARWIVPLERDDDGVWRNSDGDTVDFLESDELPSEHWLQAPQCIWDKGSKEDVRAVAAQWGETDVFVLDSSEVEWLQANDPAAICWLPPEYKEVCA